MRVFSIEPQNSKVMMIIGKKSSGENKEKCQAIPITISINLFVLRAYGNMVRLLNMLKKKLKFFKSVHSLHYILIITLTWVLSKWQIPVCVLTIFHELVSADHTVAVGIHAWENWLDFLLHINPVVRLWFNSNHVVDGICNLTKDFEVNLEAILVWF